MKNILILGPRFSKNCINGGVIILFENFINECNNFNITFTVIDTNKLNYKNKISSIILITFKLLKLSRKNTSIFLHGTVNDFLFFGPILILISFFTKKKIFLRKFAGNLDEVYCNSNYLIKYILYFVLKNSSMNFFETKYLVYFFTKFNKKTYWFPNVRKNSNFNTSTKFRKKFIYLGHLKKEKGIDDIFEAALKLPPNYHIHFYGEIFDKNYYSKFNLLNVLYKGNVEPKRVCELLSNYDVLLLPSYREGYPGVIIEAFSVGLPVIATSLNGISEIVIDYHNGILVPINSPSRILKAIKYFNSNNYLNMSINAKKSFKLFDSSIQTRNIINLIFNES